MGNPLFCYRVYWEHTDAGGVVYHSRYLNFLERARSDWLTAIGIRQTELRQRHGLVFVVRRMEIDFRRPARLEDELAIEVGVEHCGRARIDFVQRIFRESELLLEARVRAACIDVERFAPAPMPAELCSAIASARAVASDPAASAAAAAKP